MWPVTAAGLSCASQPWIPSFSFSPGADSWLLLPSAGRPVDSLSAVVVVLEGEPSLTLSAFILACSGLLDLLWLRLRLWWLRCLLLRGLGLWDLVFMRTTVLSSSELKSELSEELLSGPEVGSWIWRCMNKRIRVRWRRQNVTKAQQNVSSGNEKDADGQTSSNSTQQM